MRMHHWLLACALLLSACQFSNTAWALNILAPGDAIQAADLDATFTSGSNTPAEETAPKLFDDLYLEADYVGYAAKYLNFGKEYSGFIVTPQSPSEIHSFVWATANDELGRSPTSYQLWGTNDFITSTNNSLGNEENWTFISEGDLTVPATTYTLSDPVSFANSSTYSSYRMIFPTIQSATANSLQMGEMSFYTSTDGTGVDVATNPSNVLAIRLPPVPNLTSDSAYPAGEAPENILDGDSGTKYLNQGDTNSGFIVTPAYGSSVLESFRITTANDFEERDPASWQLYGTNDAVTSPNHSNGGLEDWTLIDQGDFSGNTGLPVARYTPSPKISINNPNGDAYTSYMMVFPTLRDPNNTGAMQIADVEFFESDPVTLSVNALSGEVTIQADANVTIGRYEITSQIYGSLDPSELSGIGTLDGTPSNSMIAETIGGGGLPLTTGQSVSLGSIFLTTPYNDLRLKLYDENGILLAENVELTPAAANLGDLDSSGGINLDDYNLFIANYGGTFTGDSIAEAYLKGDLDGDFDSDLDDFWMLVRASNGLEALLSPSTTVPEPGTGLLFVLAGGFVLAARRFRGSAVAFGLAALSMLVVSESQAQTYTSLGIPTTYSGSAPDNVNRGVENLFDDFTIEDPIYPNLTIQHFNRDYNNVNPDVFNGGSYAGQGVGPQQVYMDYGSQITANAFSFAQRDGDLPKADRVGTWEFWFSDTPFGDDNNELPTTAPDATFHIDGDDSRLLDSFLRPYPLGNATEDQFTFQYAAMQFTISEVSVDQQFNNIGGAEFRFAYGPSPVVLEINRQTGVMTLKNNGTSAQAFDLRSIEIESPLGGLDTTGYLGLTGAAGDPFPSWQLGGGSDEFHITEATYPGTTLLAAGASIELGTGYNVNAATEDVLIRFAEMNLGNEANPNGVPSMYDGIVRYVGPPSVKDPGDFNSDGFVDIADYVVWRNNLGGDAAAINFNGAGGVVTTADYEIWKDNFGTTYGSLSAATSPTAVPEPSALALIGLVTIGAFGTRFGRRA